MRAKLPPAARGYDRNHRKVRSALKPMVDRGDAVCARCGKRIRPGEPWDLGHSDDRTHWTGPEHQSCNRAAGARKVNASRRQHVDPPPPPGW